MDYITIELSKKGKHKGKYVAIVDSIDADLAELNWCVLSLNSNRTYVYRRDYFDKKPKSVLLHREIMRRILPRELLSTDYIDHIDGNPLNNRRGNLRLATNAENMWNRGKTSHNKSGYKGVRWHNRAQKWYAQITVNGKAIHLGSFDTPELAYAAYCEKAKELHGEFANFG